MTLTPEWDFRFSIADFRFQAAAGLARNQGFGNRQSQIKNRKWFTCRR
jgi:hypothetical protein